MIAASSEVASELKLDLTALVRGLRRSRLDVALGGIVFLLVLSIFLISRVHQLADSNYSMLLSQSLIHHRTFTLDRYSIPRLHPTPQLFHISNGTIYQLELVNDHIYYFWPPGTSVLSVPFVALMNASGVSAANADGSYNSHGEVIIQARLAALLMAALASLFYFTSRLLLPPGWSLLLSLGAALGTQIWSTASRALWSDTWGIFLLGFVVLSLIAQELGIYRLRPALLATLLAWTYFVRPTFALPIVAITIYIAMYHGRLFMPYATVGTAWFSVFAVYSWSHFSQVLPNYYFVYQHFGSTPIWLALFGNLLSPSRGLLVFVPVLLFVSYLLVRYRATLPLRRLVVLSLVIVSIHLIVVSSHSPWYGGHSYGPRYSTGIVPWFYLLAVSGLQAWRRSANEQTSRWQSLRRRLEAFIGALLLLLSVTINALGATSHATWLWNSRPVNVDQEPDRVWDWKHPQFLATWDN
ncbi:MAG: DUF2079 domain-containing protein [Acidobacteriota bacterium]|nr:DUF2079 domain-containing protein [Acidobacteriota bacterium]